MSEKPTYEELEKQVLGLKKAELKYKRAESFLMDEIFLWHILFEQSRDGIVVLDQKGKVYDANKRFVDMLGYSRKEIHQLHVWDWDTQFSKEQIIEMIRSIDEAGAIFETYQRRKDGTIVNVELSNNGVVYRGQKLVFCICRDITERKKTFEAVKEQKEFSEKILQTSNAIIVGLDKNRKIRIFNRGAEKITGFKSEEVIGKDWYKLFFRPGIYDEMEKVWESAWGAEFNFYKISYFFRCVHFKINIASAFTCIKCRQFFCFITYHRHTMCFKIFQC